MLKYCRRAFHPRSVLLQGPSTTPRLANPALGLGRPYQSRQLPTASSRALKSALLPEFRRGLRRYLLADGFVLALLLAVPGLTGPEARNSAMSPCGPPNRLRQSTAECAVRNLSSHSPDTRLLHALETLLFVRPCASRDAGSAGNRL